jgi:hypothetical protein
MSTFITWCYLLVRYRRSSLGCILVAQKRFRQPAVIFNDEDRIWRERKKGDEELYLFMAGETYTGCGVGSRKEGAPTKHRAVEALSR